KNLAIFGYWRGAERLPGELRNHILSAAFADGWFWYIPLHDDTMSVGAVVDVRRWDTIADADPEATYRGLVSRCPAVSDRLRAATLVSPIRLIRDYSYDSTRFWGPGWLLAGDAACFIDPVFSTGVHLACLAGFLGARAARSILRDGAPEEQALSTYEKSYRGAFERYLRFLYFFYDHNTDPDSYFWTAPRLLLRDRAPSPRSDPPPGDARRAHRLRTAHVRRRRLGCAARRDRAHARALGGGDPPGSARRAAGQRRAARPHDRAIDQRLE